MSYFEYHVPDVRDGEAAAFGAQVKCPKVDDKAKFVTPGLGNREAGGCPRCMHGLGEAGVLYCLEFCADKGPVRRRQTNGWTVRRFSKSLHHKRLHIFFSCDVVQHNGDGLKTVVQSLKVIRLVFRRQGGVHDRRVEFYDFLQSV